MSQGTSPIRTRRKPHVTYARLVEAAAERGRTLLTLEWRGVKPYYEFRRESAMTSLASTRSRCGRMV